MDAENKNPPKLLTDERKKQLLESLSELERLFSEDERFCNRHMPDYGRLRSPPPNV